MTHTVLSTKHLFAALEGHPDRPSFATVRRWAEGETPIPLWARLEIARLLGLPVASQTPKEAAPPYWAERLLTGAMALEKKSAVSDSELADAQALAAAWVAVEEDRRRRGQSSGGGQTGNTP